MAATVLVVDDDPQLRRLIAIILHSEGFDTAQFLVAAREAGFAAPTLLLSAAADLPRRARALRADWMRKPFVPDELVAEVRRLIESGPRCVVF